MGGQLSALLADRRDACRIRVRRDRCVPSSRLLNAESSPFDAPPRVQRVNGSG